MFDIIVTIVTVVFAIVSLLMILIILLQSGKGGMGTALGGGASQSVFGGGGSADVLAKATQIFAGAFMVGSIFLAYASANSESSRLKSASEELEGQSDLLGEDQPIDYERLGNWQPLPPADAAIKEGPSSTPIPDAPPPTEPEPAPSEAAPPAGAPNLALPPTDLKLKQPFGDSPTPAADETGDAKADAPAADAKAEPEAKPDAKAADAKAADAETP